MTKHEHETIEDLYKSMKSNHQKFLVVVILEQYWYVFIVLSLALAVVIGRWL